jgi:dimethylamine/trimethylamine dehydrogenase
MQSTDKYLQTLLKYYEEEISGEAYFYGLAEHFDESEKLVLLAKIERLAAQEILPLLNKYGLIPRDESVLKTLGEGDVEPHESYSWPNFLKHILDRYPGYLEEFARLEDMAPEEDLYALKILTEHEIAVIDFAQKEVSNDPESVNPLLQYLNR